MQLKSTYFKFSEKDTVLTILVVFRVDALKRNELGKIERLYLIVITDSIDRKEFYSYQKPTNRNAQRFAVDFKKEFWETRPRKGNA